MSSHVARSILFVMTISIGVLAQAQTTANRPDQASKPSIIIGRQLVRFITQGEAVEWHLVVTNQQAEVIFDSGTVYSTTLEWPLKNQQDEAVPSGLYAYALTTKAVNEETPRTQRGHLIVDRASSSDRVWLTSTQPVDIGADSATPQMTISGSRGETIGGAELPNNAPRREVSSERGTLQRDAAGRSVVEQTTTTQKNGGLGPPLKATNAQDLVVDGNIIFTPPSQGFTRDITMQNNNFGLRFYGSPFPLTQPPAAAAIQFWGNAAPFPGQLFLDSGAHNSAALIFRTATAGNNVVERMRVDASGNVGIGTNGTPQTKLDVRGDVKLGNTGQLFAPGGEENLRIIRGVVDGAGNIIVGSGFTVTHGSPGSGQYTVNFNTPFNGAPAVIATANTAVSERTISTAGVTSTAASFLTFLSGSASDTAFHFIAIGPR